MSQEWADKLRSLNREYMHAIWEKAKDRRLDGLDESEKQIAMIMLDHAAEFHNQFEFADVTKEHEFDLEDEVNPFMHICLHVVVENQLAERNPPEVFHFYNAMMKKKCTRHDALHLIANILFPMVFQVLRTKKPFDLERYRTLLQKMKNRKPEEIADLVEAELDETGFFDDLAMSQIETIESREAKQNLDALIDEIAADGSPKILRSKKGSEAVLLSLDDYKLFMENYEDDFSELDPTDNDEIMDPDNPNPALPLPIPLNRNFAQVYCFRVTLEETEPPVWRQIEVPETYTFWDLHVAIQDAMGWLDSHLHRFEMKNPATNRRQEIGVPGFDDWEEKTAIGWQCPISDFFSIQNPTALYLYDFGDNWRHSVVLESILERRKKQAYPFCPNGKRACPPEDCGGVAGYHDLLKIVQNPNDKGYEETMEWIGKKYDPDLFEPQKVFFWDPRKRWKMVFEDNE